MTIYIFTDLENRTNCITFVACFPCKNASFPSGPIWQYQATLIPQGHLNLINNNCNVNIVWLINLSSNFLVLIWLFSSLRPKNKCSQMLYLETEMLKEYLPYRMRHKSVYIVSYHTNCFIAIRVISKDIFWNWWWRQYANCFKNLYRNV